MPKTVSVELSGQELSDVVSAIEHALDLRGDSSVPRLQKLLARLQPLEGKFTDKELDPD